MLIILYWLSYSNRECSSLGWGLCENKSQCEICCQDSGCDLECQDGYGQSLPEILETQDLQIAMCHCFPHKPECN